MTTTKNTLMATLAKAASFGMLAAALAVAAPQKAQAQVAFGVRVGPVAGYYAPRPVYGPPVVYGRGYVGYPAYGYGGYGYAHRDWERERFEHREYDRRFDRRGWR